MTTENQNAIINPKRTTIGNTENNPLADYSVKVSTTLDEKKRHNFKAFKLKT